MRKFGVLACFAVVALLLTPGAVFAEYDISGWWLLEGSGYAEKNFLRTELTDTGRLDIQTKTEDGVQYVLGYSVDLRLDASRLNINTWDYSKIVLLDVPVPIPELNPTTNEPFELPRVTADGLTYEMTFTTATSGTVRIYGYIDVDVVGSVEINSISTIWKYGTEQPDVSDMTSGCDVGLGFFATGIATLAYLYRKGRSTQ
ncbi:MAG: hypothetical protein LBP21_03825 [Synergistaceae bacterium]|jgi:hypothetical protein|nr:hypothetical protein [Synergistaceae bacterium]